MQVVQGIAIKDVCLHAGREYLVHSWWKETNLPNVGVLTKNSHFHTPDNHLHIPSLASRTFFQPSQQTPQCHILPAITMLVTHPVPCDWTLWPKPFVDKSLWLQNAVVEIVKGRNVITTLEIHKRVAIYTPITKVLVLDRENSKFMTNRHDQTRLQEKLKCFLCNPPACNNLVKGYHSHEEEEIDERSYKSKVHLCSQTAASTYMHPCSWQYA